MTFSRLPLFVLALIFSLAGCKKYDQNGSLLHFKSPEKRLVGTWKSVEVNQVGTADTNLTEFLSSSNLLLEAVFEEEGTVTVTNINEEITYDGLWAFNDDKSVLHLDELTFVKTTGPFFLDSSEMDQTELVEQAYDYLLNAGCNDTLFFATGTHSVVTDDVFACYEMLTATGANWVLSEGTLNYNGSIFNAGDIINEAIEEYIDGFIDDEMLDASCEDELSADCIEQVVALTLQDYNANVAFVETSTPVITGWDDPALLDALLSECGLDVTWYDGTPSGWDDSAVLGLIADNPSLDLDCDGVAEPLGVALESTYVTEVKELDVYWEILELELDDLQAYQFREYDGETIQDFNYLLRFEKQN